LVFNGFFKSNSSVVDNSVKKDSEIEFILSRTGLCSREMFKIT